MQVLTLKEERKPDIHSGALKFTQASGLKKQRELLSHRNRFHHQCFLRWICVQFSPGAKRQQQAPKGK